MQIFADIYELTIEKTAIDQEAASLGAAALALKGIGVWNDFSSIDKLHTVEETYIPHPENKPIYENALRQFRELTLYIASHTEKQHALIK